MLFKVYPKLSQNYRNPEILCEFFTVLQNMIIQNIIATIIKYLQDQSTFYKSADTNNIVDYIIDFYNPLMFYFIIYPT